MCDQPMIVCHPTTMRSMPRFTVVCLAALTLASASAAAAADSATGTVVVTAQFSSRTSLRISSELLQFDVAAPGQAADAAVDFSAGARTHSGSEVMLSVEPVRGLNGPGGAADVESSVSLAGQGDGTLTGSIGFAGPTVAGRWAGSGLRTGRLVFSLRVAASGRYTLPVRFVLTAP
jgi:hypothetical protein